MGKWLVADINKLRKWYPKYSNAWIAQRLHRNPQCVAAKACALHLTKPKSWLRSTAGKLAKKSWANAQSRKRRMRALRKSIANPIVQINRSLGQVRSWQDPDIRVHRIAAAHSPKTSAKRRQSLGVAMRKPRTRAKLSASSHKWMTKLAASGALASRSRANWNKPDYRNKVTASTLCTHRTKQYRRAMRRRAKILWSDPEFRAKVIRGVNKPAAREKLALVRAAQGQNRSRFAHRIRTALNLPNQDVVLFGEAWDGAWPKHKVLLECQGCYWHGCRRCNRPGARSMASDTRKKHVAKHNGWKVVYIWEHDEDKVLADTDGWLRRNGITKDN